MSRGKRSTRSAKRHTFKQTKLAYAVTTALASTLFGSNALAQTTNDDIEEVVVSGIRGSLERSMDIKRDAMGVVDAISAEDIGKFPDTNLAESMQRITGVSIDRRNGEGSQVTIRGFGGDNNMVLLNGRIMPAADNFGGSSGAQGTEGGAPRAFNFANLASEGVSGIEVYKTSKANIVGGGIGGTINIKTTRPLDNPGFQLSVGAKLLNDTTNRIGDDWTPEVSGIFSWTDDNETFGVSVSTSYQERNSAAAQLAMNGWHIAAWDEETWEDEGQNLYSFTRNSPTNVTATVLNRPDDGQLYARPDDVRYAFSDRSRERTNGQLTVQFRPMDSLTLTGDFTYAENELWEHRGEQTFWIANNGSVSRVEFDDSIVAMPLIVEEASLVNKDNGHEQQWREQTNKLESRGFNADWQVTDNFNLNFDYHNSNMDSIPTGPAGSGSMDMPIGVRTQASQLFNFGGELPVVSTTHNDGVPLFDSDDNPILDSEGNQVFSGNNNGVFDLGDVGTQIGRIWFAQQTTDIEQVKIDGTFEFDDDSRFNFGIDAVTAESNRKQSNNQMTFGNWSIDDAGQVPEEFMELFCLVCQFDDQDLSAAQQEGVRGDAVAIMQWAVERGQAGLYPGDPSTYSFAINPVMANDDTVKEEVNAFYFQFATAGELGGMPTHMLVGVRYEDTEVTSTSNFTAPAHLIWEDDNDFQPFRPAGASAFLSVENEYDHLLPSFDFDIDFREDLKGRVSFSKSIARAPRGDLSPAVENFQKPGSTLLGNLASAESANPDLIPLESDNFDLSAEWYYDDASYVSVGYYEKRVKNFIGNAQIERNHFGILDQTAGPRAEAAVAELEDRGINVNNRSIFVMLAMQENGEDLDTIVVDPDGNINTTFADSIASAYDIIPESGDPEMIFRTSQPLNNREFKINGMELAVQHFFGDTGFGVQANYTTVNGDLNIDPSAPPTEEQFALTGLSDTANLVVIYDKHGWQARLAYNWRDEFLTEVERGAGNSPRFVEEYSQVDFSVSYDISDNLNVSFEGLNITEEDVRQHGRNERQIWFYEDLGARYALGARYTF